MKSDADSVRSEKGQLFDGVIALKAPGKASGRGAGYVIGTTPLHPLLRVGREQGATAELVGLKYYEHPSADKREGDPAPSADDEYRLTMLVSEGAWRQRLWN